MPYVLYLFLGYLSVLPAIKCFLQVLAYLFDGLTELFEYLNQSVSILSELDELLVQF